MGTLDEVTQMKNQGVPENDIINKLQEQGVSPKAINDAMDQSKIKDAVSKPVLGGDMEPSVVGGGNHPAGSSARAQEIRNVPNDEFYIPQSKPGFSRNQPSTQEYQENPNQNYSQNYNQTGTNQRTYEQAPPQETYDAGYGEQTDSQQAQPQETYDPGYSEQTDYQQDYGEQTGYTEEYYPQEGYEQDYENYGTQTDTMIEIAEQVFAEKTRKMQKQLEDLNEFKTLTETKLDNATTRLKRIENVMDKLQMAILEKIGSYGKSLESIKKEMAMMQDSFSKTLPILAAKHSTPVVHKKPTTIVKKTISRKKEY